MTALRLSVDVTRSLSALKKPLKYNRPPFGIDVVHLRKSDPGGFLINSAGP